MERRIVITGLGIVSPLGCHVESVWQNLLAGKCGIVAIDKYDTTGFRTKVGAYVADDFSTEGVLDGKEVKRLDESAIYAIVAAEQAVKDSGIDFSQENPLRCASIIGSGIGGLLTLQEQEKRLLAMGPSKVSAFTIPRMIANAPAAHVSIRYNLQGPSFSVLSACASASHSMATLIDAMRLGKVDVGLTGGSEAALIEIAMSAFCAMRAMSERNDDPQGASRPFDLDRDGFVMGEGAGILVFEELEHAKKRGAKIYAEVLGYGVSSDAYHIVQPNESGDGAAHALRYALEDAKRNPDQVDYINAHGTSTTLGDIAETNAIKQVFGDYAYKLNVSSTKSETGHLLGASGGIELIFSTLALRDQVIPPTINLETPDPKCDLNYTPNQAQERKCDCVVSNNFGFGGHNATLVIGRYFG
ncbi:MAG: beta-ketoacyl-ACP synthase II [Planctomycetia bacterium]|nr:beta-ketoacyl-ACP synthase II [Planctomycetia bacterium]